MPLVLVPTPIGNLKDITLRALERLRAADVVACEDTRRTLALLTHFEIKKPLCSYHEHNEAARVPELIARVERGETVCLVSDAGTPAVSDPGWRLLQAAIERDLPIEVLPGANAILPALLFSGIEPEPFCFVGFLKGRAKQKKEILERLAAFEGALVFYVSPHRVREELALLFEALGDRPAALVREISKLHEEAIRLPLAALCAELDRRESLKGEMVCVVAGASPGAKIADDAWELEAQTLRREGRSMKEIARMLEERYRVPRNAVKKFLLREAKETREEPS